VGSRYRCVAHARSIARASITIAVSDCLQSRAACPYDRQVTAATARCQSPGDIDWFHQIELPDGTITAGRDRSAEKLAALHLPDLNGKTVLDVGAWDGYFSFAAERMGAARVLATDAWVWQHPGGKDGFSFARKALGSAVQEREIEVLDISPRTVGRFDVVFFLGVLYHMRHPLLALERMASVTGELLVLETLVDMTFIRSPVAAFYPWELHGDETNWWGPNRAAVEGMLRSVGFSDVAAYPVRRFTSARLRGLPKRARVSASNVSAAPAGARPRRLRDALKSVLVQSRLVVHARR
jgi:tRNA (mo5U34)-methyltransferase